VAAITLSIFAGGGAFPNANAQTTRGGENMTMTMNNNQTMASSGTEVHNTNSTVVRDSETILLEGMTIPANGYIHLYDTTPYMIMNGHVAAKLPCDSNSNSTVQVLIGSAPDLSPADFELIAPLSQPGDLCLYHVDLMSSPAPTTGGNATIITDIAISNPTDEEIVFPPSATVVIGVNEIGPGAEENAHEEVTEE
jgi:hypothetical protein